MEQGWRAQVRAPLVTSLDEGKTTAMASKSDFGEVLSQIQCPVDSVQQDEQVLGAFCSRFCQCNAPIWCVIVT